LISIYLTSLFALLVFFLCRLTSARVHNRLVNATFEDKFK
jgi:hypothetical protein